MTRPKKASSIPAFFAIAVELGREHHGHNSRAADAKVLLLIAGILRNVPSSDLEEIEKMLRVNIHESRLLRQVYEDGAIEEAVEVQLDMLERLLAKRDVMFSPKEREYMSGFGLDGLETLYDLALDKNWAEIREFVTPPSPSFTMNMSPSSIDDD